MSKQVLWRVYRVVKDRNGHPMGIPHRDFSKKSQADAYAGVSRGFIVLPTTTRKQLPAHSQWELNLVRQVKKAKCPICQETVPVRLLMKAHIDRPSAIGGRVVLRMCPPCHFRLGYGKLTRKTIDRIRDRNVRDLVKNYNYTARAHGGDHMWIIDYKKSVLGTSK